MSVTSTTRRSNISATIASRLRAQILNGELAPSQLPGHRDLAAIHSVSVGSIREAISMLVSNGPIETRAGRATYVATSPSTALTPPVAAPLAPT